MAEQENITDTSSKVQTGTASPILTEDTSAKEQLGTASPTLKEDTSSNVQTVSGTSTDDILIKVIPKIALESTCVAPKSLFQSFLDAAKENRDSNNYEESLNNLYKASVALKEGLDQEVNKESALLEIYEAMSAINPHVISSLLDEYNKDVPDYNFILKTSEKSINIIENLSVASNNLYLGVYYYYQGLGKILDHFQCNEAIAIFNKHIDLFPANYLEAVQGNINYCNNEVKIPQLKGNNPQELALLNDKMESIQQSCSALGYNSLDGCASGIKEVGRDATIDDEPI